MGSPTIGKYVLRPELSSSPRAFHAFGALSLRSPLVPQNLLYSLDTLIDVQSPLYRTYPINNYHLMSHSFQLFGDGLFWHLYCQVPYPVHYQLPYVQEPSVGCSPTIPADPEDHCYSLHSISLLRFSMTRKGLKSLPKQESDTNIPIEANVPPARSHFAKKKLRQRDQPTGGITVFKTPNQLKPRVKVPRGRLQKS